jgi:hypothetical protein
MMALGRGIPAEEEELSCWATDPFRLAEANINPVSGLSTDYLNHFNEAVMLLEMVPVMPECRQDLAEWRPLTYHDHFRRSQLKHRELMMAAYDLADPTTRVPFDSICDRMKALVLTASSAMTMDLPAMGMAQIAEEAAAGLKMLIGRANFLIHGRADTPGDHRGLAESQADIDAILTA